VSTTSDFYGSTAGLLQWMTFKKYAHVKVLRRQL